MGRSLVLSFLIITVVFYTMGRPTNNAGKIDYIHSVKNHDFSARTVEKKFFKALRPQEVQNKNQRIGHLPTQIKRITPPTQNLRITSNLPAKIALPSAKPKPVVSSLPPPFDASTQAKTTQPTQAFKLSQLPSYLPFNNISEKSITRKTVQEQKKLAESQKNAPKVARIHPKELENELMDFQPVEHIYTTPTKPTKPITAIKSLKNKEIKTQNVKSAALPANEPKNMAVARPKRRSLEKVQTLNPTPKGRSFVLTTLPVKRSPFSNTASQTQKIASIALPTKADRSEFQRSKTIRVASSSPEIEMPLRAAKTSKRHLKRRARTSLKRITAKRSTASLARKIRSRKLRAKRYALKRKRTKALLRQTQRKLRRKKRTASRARSFARQAKNKQSIRRKISSFSRVKKGRKAPRFDTVLNKLNQRQNRKYAEQNRRRVRQQLRRQRARARARARQFARKTNISRNKKVADLSRRNTMTFNPIAQYKKRNSRRHKKTIQKKLKNQRRNARRNSRKSNRSDKIKVARLTRKNTSTRKNQRKLKRKLSQRNKKYFNRKVTKRTRTNSSKKLRAKNKTILRKINKKLRKKSRKTQKIAALKRTKRTKTNSSKKLRAKNKTILRKINKKLRKKSRKTQKIAALKRTRTKLKNNRKKRKTKTKKFAKPRLRKNTKKRRIAKKSKSRKKKYKRVARRTRAAKKVFGFNMDGTLNN